jgi:hypothetical protein
VRLFFTVPGTSPVPTLLPVQCASGTLPLEFKRQGRESDHSRPPSAEVKDTGAVPSLPYICSQREKFTLPFFNGRK